jgi:hypothetical protein
LLKEATHCLQFELKLGLFRERYVQIFNKEALLLLHELELDLIDILIFIMHDWDRSYFYWITLVYVDGIDVGDIIMVGVM